MKDDSNKPHQSRQFGYTMLEDDMAIGNSPTSRNSQPPVTPQRGNRTPRQIQSPSPTPTRNQTPQNRQSWAPENLNVRVVLEHQYPQHSDPRRFSYSPLSNHEHARYPSIRRRKSRSGLKEYSAKQALHELAQSELEDRDYRSSDGEKVNGIM